MITYAFIGFFVGILFSVGMWFLANEIKSMYSEVAAFRREKIELQAKINLLRLDALRTQEDINDFYEWRKTRS